ncbi:class I SAM-dependent methyltransferase [Halarcobacter ebronensis]|uniref:Methyltransferase n=1 Tax=Halarcobacter ebronensis TaxID=1462615 RepID=A0A4Q1ANQ8_9BACT|nr:class I SAM-dependent methyltransferase [Halarcobacter ebronensis]QKF83324.1 SAM-dependent methyltransferase [Halarcobacter ebronensis]RXK05886.1 methyltransferase [Halarcobacter ebronensis]
MNCKLCGSNKHRKRSGSVRDNKDLDIYECCNCGLVYLSESYQISDTFYENSKMHSSFDFEKWRKQTFEDDSRRFESLKNTITNKKLLDFGSGNGGFLKLAKNVCTKVCGVELEKAVKEYYEKDKIELFSNLNECNKKFDIITSFHVIEHIKEPIEILEKLKSMLNDKGRLIIEVPNANDALLTIYESEAFSHFTYWSCHLYLYTQYTLSLLAKKAGLKVEFIKHIQRYPLSNHLYWLSKNAPGGHEKWGNFLDSKELTNAYESQLATLNATDTIIASFTKEN